MKSLALPLGAAVAVAVVGCGPSPTPSPIATQTLDPAAFEIPVHDTAGAQMDALMIGTLEEAGGCFFVQTKRVGRFLVIWPRGFVGRHTLNGDVVVPLDGPVFELGDTIRMAGGAFEQPPFDEIFRVTGPTLHAGCEVPPYWIGWDPQPG